MAVGAQNEYRPAASGPVELRERWIAAALILVQSVAEKPLAVVEGLRTPTRYV